MAVHLATRTSQAIARQMEEDQGASYRTHLKELLPLMGDAYRGVEKNPFRNHLGLSGIGKECGRAIWYAFRWYTKPSFSDRMLRLFNRGHIEEARFLAQLKAIGVTIYLHDANGKQFRISELGGHLGGSTDGVGVGIPDLPPGLAALLEFKTHNDKSFIKLKKEGVQSAKPDHFVQMQTYMRKMGLTVALYGAVNKNDDEVYWEIVPLETLVADQYLDRGRQIVFLRDAPKRISESPGWWACGWCDHKPVCHLKKEVQRNCRTCHFAHAEPDGTWACKVDGANHVTLTEDMQLAACKEYTQL